MTQIAKLDAAEAKVMTPKQSHTVWNLRRQGLQAEAEIAERSWSRGRAFVPDQRAPLKGETLELIQQCNWEVKMPAVA
jgi:hypothetical protein